MNISKSTFSISTYPNVKLGHCVSFKTGKLNSNAAKKNGVYPFFTCSQDIFKIDTFSFDTECVLLGGNNANGIYPIFYYKGKFDVYQRTYVIRSVDKDKLINRYLFYALKLQLELLRSISTGAATKFLTLTILNEIEIPLPPLPIQRKIAAILSAYDDLIENNTRRIRILEEMAQAIYREWFVHFRFPGHEGVRMVKSELGLIPEGWEKRKISDIAELYRGKSYGSENLVEAGGLPFFNLKCINRDGGFRRSGIKRYHGPYKETQTAIVGNLIIAVTDMTQERRIVAHVARIPIMEEPIAIFSMDLVKIEPKEKICSEYLYGLLRYSSFSDEVKQHANGVNVLHLKPDHIGDYEFYIAPEKLQKQFSEIASTIFKMCDFLELKNINLRRTRDLLLPRLISGELDVSELDIVIPEEDV